MVWIYQCFWYGTGGFYRDFVFFEFRRHAFQHFCDQLLQIRLLHCELGQLCTTVQFVNAAIEILAALDEMVQVFLIFLWYIQKLGFRFDGKQLIFHVMAECFGGSVYRVNLS